MALKTNLTSLTPAREKFKREITLLSHGYAAPQSFPDGKITVYPWDPETDDWIVDRIRRSGGSSNFMWDLCARQCDLKGCPIDRFVVGDVNTVILVSRGIMNRNVVQISPKCPMCGKQATEEIKVPDNLSKIGEKSADYPGYDTITLPDCKDAVKIRPLVVGDMKKIDGRPEDDKLILPDRLLKILVPVVEVNDTTPDTFSELQSWYDALHPIDKQELQDKEDELYPHLDQNLSVQCDNPDCKHIFQHILTFNEKFFR